MITGNLLQQDATIKVLNTCLSSKHHITKYTINQDIEYASLTQLENTQLCTVFTYIGVDWVTLLQYTVLFYNWQKLTKINCKGKKSTSTPQPDPGQSKE